MGFNKICLLRKTDSSGFFNDPFLDNLRNILSQEPRIWSKSVMLTHVGRELAGRWGFPEHLRHNPSVMRGIAATQANILYADLQRCSRELGHFPSATGQSREVYWKHAGAWKQMNSWRWPLNMTSYTNHQGSVVHKCIRYFQFYVIIYLHN